MSYEPKEWVSGEVITADKLNNIEEGVQEALEGSGEKMIVNVNTNDPQNPTADHTFQEIKEAYNNGVEVIAKYIYTGTPFSLRYALSPVSAVDVGSESGEIEAFTFSTLAVGDVVLVAGVTITENYGIYYGIKELQQRT